MHEPNQLLRAARERTPSRIAPGECMGRAELAEAVNAWLWETTRTRYDLDAHTIARYERGVVRWPSSPYRSGLRHVLNARTDHDLGFRPHRAGATVPLSSVPPVAQAIDVASTMQAIANQSADWIRIVETTNAGPVTVEQLQTEIVSIAVSYFRLPATTVADQVAAVRQRIFELLHGTHPPGQRSDLYLLAGQASGLLAHACKDLGFYDAAVTHARLAWSCGHAINHPALFGWARGLQAIIAFWSGRPNDARALAEEGLCHLTTSATACWLRGIEARARGRMCDVTGAKSAIEHSTAPRANQASGDICEVLGGAAGFGRAKAAYYATNALCWAGDVDAAVEVGEQALRLYSACPSEERSLTGEATVRTDLAMGLARKRDHDAVQLVFAPVLALEPEVRSAGLRQQVRRLRRVANDQWAGCSLDEEIDRFLEVDQG